MVELHKRKPDVYKTNKCIKCRKPETIDHIITAHDEGIDIYKKFIKNTVQEIVKRKEEKVNTTNLKKMIEKALPENSFNKMLIRRGILTKKITKVIRE